MFNIFQKNKLESLASDASDANKIEVNTQTGEVKLYHISWNARKGPYSSDVYRTAKAFVTKNDAIAFKKQLELAAKILKNEENLHIEMEEQTVTTCI